MEKEFVPYEQAIELKKLGFNVPSVAGYSYPNSDKLLTQAILYQQAFRWFREKYNLIGLVEAGYDNGKNVYTYVYWDGFKDYLYDEYFQTYEEAELACLNKLIEVVKSKNMKNNKTPVQLFFEKLEQMQYFIGNDIYAAYKEILIIEKERLEEAYDQGEFDCGSNGTAEDWYNKKYKS